MVTLAVDRALFKAKFRVKKGKAIDGGKLYWAVLEAFHKNNRAQDRLLALSNYPNKVLQSLSQENTNKLIEIYQRGQLSKVIENKEIPTRMYFRLVVVWNVLEKGSTSLGITKNAYKDFRKVTGYNLNCTDIFNNFRYYYRTLLVRN